MSVITTAMIIPIIIHDYSGNKRNNIKATSATALYYVILFSNINNLIIYAMSITIVIA